MIDALDALSAEALARLFRVAWQAAALIVVVLAAERLLGSRLGPRWRYALWLLVALRLVIPELPRVPFGLLPLEPAASRPVEDEQALEPARAADAAAAPARLAASLSARARSETKDAAVRESATPEAAGPSPPRRSDAAFFAAPPRSAASPRVPWALGAASLWLSVAAALLARHAFAAVAFARRLRLAARDVDPATVSLVESCRARLRLARRVRVLVTDLVATPAVTGAFRPALLLPPLTLARFDPDRLRPMILHELSHVRAGDLLLNWIVAAIHCLHWYHPLVRLALRRLRDGQETLRDFEALAADPGTEPERYAASLVDLLDDVVTRRAPLAAAGIVRGGSDVKRRILMIASFDRLSPKSIRGSAALGVPILAVLAVAALTSAGVAPAAPQENAGPGGPRGFESIVVVRQDARPPYEADLVSRLGAKIDVRLEASSFAALAADISRASGVNVVIDRDAGVAFEEGEFSLRLDGVPAETALRIGCDLLDLEYGFVNGAVRVGTRGSIPEAYDTRFYNVRRLLQGGDEERPGRLVDLVRECLRRSDAWNSQWASVDCWNGLLCVRQSDAAHAEIEAFLGRLANGGRTIAPGPREWQVALDEALAKPVDVSFDETPLAEVVKRLADESSVPIRVHRDAAEAPVTLALKRVPLRSVLGWIEHLTGCVADAGENGVTFTASPRVELFFFDIGDLLRTATTPDERADRVSRLEDLLRRGVEGAFEREGAGFLYWDDLMIVAQTPGVGARIEGALASLRRALGNV